MWIPESAEQIERAARAGELPETPAFDAKRELPGKGKSVDLAIDVAAMATDGGVLLYGIAKDEHERPTIPEPFLLAGCTQRISDIVGGSIDPVPFIDTREYPCQDNDSTGYIALIVPQSSQAPHQVTVGGNYRFYGRGAQGNRMLTASDVERLHERRQRWTINRWERLNEVIAHAPHAPQAELGYLHAFCQPVPPDRALWQRATSSGRDALLALLTVAARSIKLGKGGVPALSSDYNHWGRHGADAWMLVYSGAMKPGSYASCDLAMDGRAQLFMGRAADVDRRRVQPPDSAPPFFILEDLIAGNLASFFAIMGEFFRAASYVGHVDLGLAVTGIRGGISTNRNFMWIDEDTPRFTADSYSRDARVAAAELEDAGKLATELLREFFDATAGEDFDPFQVEYDQPS
jgi:hypothetical protein